MITQRVTMTIGGRKFRDWTRVEITRSLEEIAGGFELELFDRVRAERAMPSGWQGDLAEAIRCGEQCTLLIDDETVLIGYVDELKLSWQHDTMRMSLTGRDRTGDLVDCAAAPDGPAEYRRLTLTEIATRICRPYGIAVRADTDVGAAIPVFSIDPSETALSALEKAARQRAVLLVSDGIGGLLLTRGGATRGPAPLFLPGNVQDGTYTSSWRERFRDYIVKGQTRSAGGGRIDGVANPLTPSSTPLPTPPAAPAPTSNSRRERAGVVMTGRARDADVGRHRPTVLMAKTQSGGASVQVQAEWRMRVARAKSEALSYRVLDWRAGKDDRLWRPNELVSVNDQLAGIGGDMLIASVVYSYSPDGAVTRLELVGPEAYDLEPIEPRQRARRNARRAGGDGRANELRPSGSPASGS